MGTCYASGRRVRSRRTALNPEEIVGKDSVRTRAVLVAGHDQVGDHLA